MLTAAGQMSDVIVNYSHRISVNVGNKMGYIGGVNL